MKDKQVHKDVIAYLFNYQV